MTLQIINRRLDLHEFQEYCANYDFGSTLPDKIVLHHTWRPTKDRWGGEHSIRGLKKYYEGKGWPAGPHLFVADDGIWLFSPMNKDGVHAGKLNYHSIGIEVVGDYDKEVWSGQTKHNALGAIKILMDRLKISKSQIFFHSESSSKTCPGSAITKSWLFTELDAYKQKPRLPKPSPAMEAIQKISAPLPKVPAGLTALDEEVMIPIWSAEAVAWVHKNRLFEIHSRQDVLDAVKFHRLYQILKNDQR
ncbi:MAG: N-acetylmuramoyl-L-alanine amidase [Candidatus Peregrinibacteria bacterium]|nr:N-acetylmuramoyl-L-alanine amidase [Candidatus Peregrinibacteria bacterium]